MINNKKSFLIAGFILLCLGNTAMAADWEDPDIFGRDDSEQLSPQAAPLNSPQGNNFWMDENGNPHYAAEGRRNAAPSESAPKTSERKASGNSKKNGEDAVPEDTSISAQNPMYVTADRMRYDPTTGDVNAYGSVDIRHMMDHYQTEYVYGNTIAQKYVIPGELKWQNQTTDLTAQRADYDAARGLGHFSDVSGRDQGLYYYQGADGVYDRNDNKVVVENGFFTTKHAVAKVPDYSISADYIDIYPGDHYTAHNAKLKFKNFTVLTLSTYTGSLKPGNNDVNLWSLIPRPTYDSDNGWGFENGITIPIAHDPDFVFYMDNRWYNRKGFEPDIGFKYQTPIGTFRLKYSKDESTVNDDHVWVKKRPSFSYSSRHFYLGGSPFYVGARGELGFWEEGSVKGSHKDFDFYISRDPIRLGPHMAFNARAGYRKDYYGYHNLIRRNSYYSLGLSGSYKWFNAWINFTNNDLKGSTPYSFDTYDIEHPLNIGFSVQVTPLDAFSVSYTYGTTNGVLQHKYFTYYRDMHSFYGWIRYDKVDHSVKFMINPKDFRF